MSGFASLLKYRRGREPARSQQEARRRFPKQVASSRFTLREPGEEIPRVGRRVILGIATYSGQELRLLDELNRCLASGPADEVQIFDVVDCARPDDLETFIPGIGGVLRTPIVAVFVDGKLIDRATGLREVEATLERFKILCRR